MAKKEEVRVYARHGLKVTEVTKMKSLMTVFEASLKFVIELQKVNKLPYRVFVKEEDLLGLNSVLFGLEKPFKINMYMSAHKDAIPIIRIENIADEHEILEEDK